jgi:hypothetical protein
MKTEVAAQLKAAQAFDRVDEQAERHKQSSKRKLTVNWLRVSRTGQICPYTFDKLGLFMSFAAV